MLDSAFDRFAAKPALSLWPADGASRAGDELERLNDELIYPNINNGAPPVDMSSIR